MESNYSSVSPRFPAPTQSPYYGVQPYTYGWESHAPSGSTTYYQQSPILAAPGSSPHVSSSTPSSSKLTPSCSRCRTKKLRCRYTDPNSSACLICTQKGLANDCHRDIRLARTKKSSPQRVKLAKADPTKRDKVSADSSEDSRIQLDSIERRRRMAILRKKLEDLEQMERRVQKPPSPASTVDESVGHGTNAFSSSHSVDDAHAKSVQRRKETEDAALLLEEFASQGRNRSHTLPTASQALPVDVAQAKWQRPATLSERLELLQQAKSCPFASDEVVMRELVSVYLYRVNHLVGHVIHGPGYLRAVESFLTMSVEEIVMSKLFVDPCCLSTLMLVLCLGFEFHPQQSPPGRSATPGFLAVQAIRQQSLNPTKLWYSIARRSLAIEESYQLASIPAMQAACLFLVLGKESNGWMRMLHQVTVFSAQQFGLHRLDAASTENDGDMEDDDFIRLECGVRIWNFLVMRDWSMALDRSHIFLIHRSQMNTRKPLNIDDDALEEGVRSGLPMDDWTMMSYVIVQIELASLVRESVLLLNKCTDWSDNDAAPDCSSDDRAALRSALREKLSEFSRDLPHYFQLGSPVSTPGLVNVQRWLLHQQIFDFQLRLWRADLTDEEGRKSCLFLAENIIMHQANIRAICPVIDKMQVNFFHLFGACMVLLLDLIHQSFANATSRDRQIAREETRGKIREALDMFKGEAANGRACHVLHTLLMCEEERFASHWQSQTRDEEAVSLTSIAERLVQEMHPGESKPTLSTGKHIWPAFLPPQSSRETSIPDHTLLPIAGAWPNGSESLINLQRIGVPSKPASLDRPSAEAAIFDWAMAFGADPFSSQTQSTPSFPNQPTSLSGAM